MLAGWAAVQSLPSGVLSCYGRAEAPLRSVGATIECRKKREQKGREKKATAVSTKMTTLVLDNGAYNAKIGYSHENVS